MIHDDNDDDDGDEDEDEDEDEDYDCKCGATSGVDGTYNISPTSSWSVLIVRT